MSAELLKALIDYPFIYNGELYDGRRHAQLNFCKRCDTKDCQALAGKPFQHYACSKGFSCYPVRFGDSEQLVLNGLIAVEHNRNFSGERRKSYKRNAVSEPEIYLAREQLKKARDTIDLTKNEAVKDSLSYLHDIRTSVGVVLSCAQQVVDLAPGRSFAEKLGNVDGETLSLFQAVNLLENQLELADIIANPKAITYGEKHASSLHGCFYRMVKIFAPRAAERDVEIELHGHSDGQVAAYNSFQFIPLILLDNAVKYSARNSTIRVTVQDHNGKVAVTVSSLGFVVPPEEEQKIFDKYYRTQIARGLTNRGMGIGLYLGTLIATANGFEIHYKSHGVNERDVGANDFFFEMPIVP